MTHIELAAWRDRLGLSDSMAALLLGITLQGFRNQVYGSKPVSKRTALLAERAELAAGAAQPGEKT